MNVIFQQWQRIKRDKATDGGGTGGSLLTQTVTPPAPSAPPPAQGTPAAPPPTNAPEWVKSLPADLQDDPSIKKFTEVSTLAKAYKNLEKQLGKEKIPVPDQHATEEDWQNIFKKLGHPDFDKYDVKFKDGVSIDPKFAEEFKKNAHALGILPKQAQKLAEWFSDVNKGAEGKVEEARKEAVKTAATALQKEWGKDFDFEMQKTVGFLQTHAPKEFLEFIDTSGLGSNVQFIKFLNSVQKKYVTEGKEVNSGQEGSLGGIAPSEAKKKALAITADMTHAYNIKGHPNHKAAVLEVAELWEVVYPAKK